MIDQTRIIVPVSHREPAIARIGQFLSVCWPGKRVESVFAILKSARSSQQNRYLHGVAYKLLSAATGYEIEDIAEYCCGSYFGWVTVRCPKTPNNPQGVKDVPRRTTTRNEDGKRDVLKWDAFGDYVAWVQRFAASKGVLIPDPDPEYFRRTPAAANDDEGEDLQSAA